MAGLSATAFASVGGLASVAGLASAASLTSGASLVPGGVAFLDGSCTAPRYGRPANLANCSAASALILGDAAEAAASTSAAGAAAGVGVGGFSADGVAAIGDVTTAGDAAGSVRRPGHSLRSICSSLIVISPPTCG